MYDNEPFFFSDFNLSLVIFVVFSFNMSCLSVLENKPLFVIGLFSCWFINRSINHKKSEMYVFIVFD